MNYEEKKAARIERMRQRAERKRAEGQARLAQADKRAAVIPFGQPILVGHYSEGRDRRYREKIRTGFTKGFEALKEAQELESRAAAAEVNPQISSDDPDALRKLDEKIAELTALRDRAKLINKACRAKCPRVALLSLGLSETAAAHALEPDFAGRVGVPAYKLTNLGSEIRRLEARKLTLGRPALPPETFGDVEVREEDNRVRVFFPGKPSAETRSELKSHGFRWSPTEGAWQRQASPDAWYWARKIAGSLTVEAAE